MAAYRPKNLDEYLDLLDQAIHEADEIIACAVDEDAIDSMELAE